MSGSEEKDNNKHSGLSANKNEDKEQTKNDSDHETEPIENLEKELSYCCHVCERFSTAQTQEYITVPYDDNADDHADDYADVKDDRAEKPWQRVPSTLLIILLGVYLLLGYLTQLVEDDMPNIVTESSVGRDDSDTFSEEAALGYLLRILGDEPRVAGCAYHLRKTEDLKLMIDEIAAEANQVVKTDWQRATGDFRRGTASFFNVYHNISNIVALLEGESGFHENGTIGSSLLVNCHYDSVPYALGASDDGVFCAVAAETLRRLSRRKEKLRHNIVFLFNGAEENGLQASHGFLQHPWVEGVTAVINLDAAGMNGKPTIFQVTDPRVLSAYSRSVRVPNAQGLAEFLFSSGLVPSDTDFRIWREFGNIQGIDMAFTKWAHVYHTRNDKPELVLPGVVQNAGDMLLAVVTEVAQAEWLDTKMEPSAAIYYDYLNVFMVTFSFAISYVVDVFVVVVGAASVAYYVWLVGARWSTVYKLLYACLGRLSAMLAGMLAVATFTPLMVATTIQMRYMNHMWLVVPLYWLPYVIAAVAVSQAYDAWTLKKNGLSRSLRTIQAQAATRLILCIVLTLFLCIPSLSSLRYLISVSLFIMSLTSLISITIVRYVTLKGWQHLILEVVLSLPAVMFALSLALRLDAQMLPIMGRSAGDRPDYTVAMLNVALAVVVTCTVSGIELLFSRKHLWLVLGAVGSVCIVLMFIPFSPYEDEGLSVQRHYWFHTEIVSFDINNATTFRSSGVLVTKHDPYSTDFVVPALQANGYNLNVRRDFTEDCAAQVYCGLPLFRARFGRLLREALFLYTGPPAAFSPPVSLTLQDKSCANNTCHYHFVFTGANHNMITFWTREGVTISSWSLNSPPRISFYQQDRPVYVIYHSKATYDGEGMRWDFTVTFNVPDPSSQPIVDVSYHSHKINHPEDYTLEYKGILEAMPPFFNIANFLSFRHNYVF